MNLPWCGSFPNLGFSGHDYEPSAMQHATVGIVGGGESSPLS